MTEEKSGLKNRSTGSTMNNKEKLRLIPDEEMERFFNNSMAQMGVLGYTEDNSPLVMKTRSVKKS